MKTKNQKARLDANKDSKPLNRSAPESSLTLDSPANSGIKLRIS